jgi:hypothetical protein
MPADERIWFHDREETTPLDQSRQRDEGNPRGIVGAARLHLTLDVQGQLLSQEQIFSGEVRMQSDGRREQPQDVTGETQDSSDCGENAGLGHGHKIVCELGATPEFARTSAVSPFCGAQVKTASNSNNAKRRRYTTKALDTGTAKSIKMRRDMRVVSGDRRRTAEGQAEMPGTVSNSTGGQR